MVDFDFQLSDEEERYAEFAARISQSGDVINREDAARALRASGTWDSFVAQNLDNNVPGGATPNRMAALAQGRERLLDDLETTGNSLQQIRFASGRIQAVWRGEGGRFVSAGTISKELGALLRGFGLGR